jgi:hypothetical protein
MVYHKGDDTLPMNADETMFSIGAFLFACSIVVFTPLIPLIGSLAFQYSRAAHFSIISDARFILTIVLGIVGILFTVGPSIGDVNEE